MYTRKVRLKPQVRKRNRLTRKVRILELIRRHPKAKIRSFLIAYRAGVRIKARLRAPRVRNAPRREQERPPGRRRRTQPSPAGAPPWHSRPAASEAEITGERSGSRDRGQGGGSQRAHRRRHRRWVGASSWQRPRREGGWRDGGSDWHCGVACPLPALGVSEEPVWRFAFASLVRWSAENDFSSFYRAPSNNEEELSHLEFVHLFTPSEKKRILLLKHSTFSP